jgi:P27 family predicted phage terminase small subunit
VSKKKSTAFHQLAGSFKPSRHGKTSLQFPPASGTAPRWLSKAARQQWKNLVPYLLASDTLTEVDTVALATLCESIAAYLDAKRIVEESGQIIWIESTTRTGMTRKPMPNPAVALMTTHQKAILATAARYGLTPYDRGRIEGSIPDDDGEQTLQPIVTAPVKQVKPTKQATAHGDALGAFIKMPETSLDDQTDG